MQADVAEFLRLRLRNVLEAEHIRYDAADAVLGDVDDIYNVLLRARAVTAFTGQKDAAQSMQAFVRVANIARKSAAETIYPERFHIAEEMALYQAYTSTKSAVESLVSGEDFEGAIDALIELVAPIDAFFDNVMVMDKDEMIRENRLALLRSVDAVIRDVADFTKIVSA